MQCSEAKDEGKKLKPKIKENIQKDSLRYIAYILIIYIGYVN